PLLPGYIVTVYPGQTVSFKMGAPLRELGVINADVSTCIAGWLSRKADMLPLRMTAALGSDSPPHTFNVEIARQPAMLPMLVFTALANSVDMEGERPEDITAELQARIADEGHEPSVIHVTVSGASAS